MPDVNYIKLDKEVFQKQIGNYSRKAEKNFLKSRKFLVGITKWHFLSKFLSYLRQKQKCGPQKDEIRKCFGPFTSMDLTRNGFCHNLDAFSRND
ncbi:CLUMA_CG014746, isoform A [Clunio marinus]|uniref:CLUMA_CG014746, isoform A n=1 Tax=Clunio marinus TaxID=568069 RepID=A0A1J1IM61_9DIPT|nr:CLUMA_CG014746, isoform A [Clunio marinus]